MKVDLCKSSLLMAKAKALPDRLRAEGYEVVVHDCLDRCEPCELGGILGRYEGTWLAAGTMEKFAQRVEEAKELLD